MFTITNRDTAFQLQLRFEYMKYEIGWTEVYDVWV